MNKQKGFFFSLVLICIMLSFCKGPDAKKVKNSVEHVKFNYSKNNKKEWVNTNRAIRFSNYPKGINAEWNYTIKYDFVFLINEKHNLHEIESKRDIISKLINDLLKEKGFTILAYLEQPNPKLMSYINSQLGNSYFDKLDIQKFEVYEKLP